MVAVLFIVFVVALAIGVPVAFSLGLASVAYMLGSHIQMINFAQYFFKGLDSFTLLCIPGFTFAGNLMNQGGISEKLLDFADALVGHITGGLAYANVLASMVFAGISGTALSDTVALGGVEIPMMVNQGYDVPFSVAITAASSCLGPIIPPSVPMIMAATMTGLSVSKMFMAGIVPGILLGVGMTLLVSRLLSKTILKGVPSSFTLELPPYRTPQVGKVIVRSIFDRTLFVLGRAAAVAAPAGLIIWVMANVTVGDMSLLAHCSQFLDPFGRLLGLDGTILMAFILGFPANEIVIPIIIMAYMAQGSLTDMSNLNELHTLLTNNGWTWLTAVCTMLFSLMHWPCSTTCMTIHKETQSLKWTAVSFAVPTVIGMLVCLLVANGARLLGLA